MTERPQPLARLRGIGKRFGSVSVLRGVNYDILPGEVHVLAGENGAGKSTLIKILGGVYPDFDGTIEIGGQLVRPKSPLEANTLGVAVIYQELSLVPSMTVTDNIFLGRAVSRAGFVRDRVQQAQAQRLLDQLGIELDVTRQVEELPVAQQQLTEIAKALAQRAQIIVMDEPTSALNAPEVERLFGLIRDLKTRGCGIVYITHKMEEIERLADRITVLRDGELVGTAPAAELSPAKLLNWMVGRELAEQYPRHAGPPGPERLRLVDFTVRPAGAGSKPAVEAVSLTLRAGEILGVAGLQGSGASDLFLGLFGAYGRGASGVAQLDGQPVCIANPRVAIEQGVALLTNDRKATGLVLSMSVTANATLADLSRLATAGWRRPARELAAAEALGKRLSLRAATLDMEVGWLSGGNQQKVALARWLQVEPRILLLDEPTRGIDVGAKREIYTLLDQLTAQGIAIMLISSELPELLALSDRVVVLHRGRLTAGFTREQATPERILAAAMGSLADGGI